MAVISLFFAEQGTVGSYCSWCGPNRAGCLASCIVQEDGDPLLHCEGEVAFGSGNSCFICLAIKYFYQTRDSMSCQLFVMICWQIVHKKTASALCLTTVKNEDKLEFSKILEAIKVDLNCSFVM